MSNHSITCNPELRNQVWLKAGQPLPNRDSNYVSIVCDNNLWQWVKNRAQFVSMSMLIRTLWSMWVNDKIEIEGFNGFITLTALVETLLSMWLEGEVEIDREDWVR